jgi:MFS family permease
MVDSVPTMGGVMETREHTGRLLTVLLIAPFLAQVDATIANVATPTIRQSLGASGAGLELVIGGYIVAFAVLLITGARLGKTHGYKRLFLLGLGLFGVASLFGGLAPNITVLILMRVLQGAAAALMFPQALTGIQLNVEGAQRTRAIGRYAIALSTGAVSGQVLGGMLISADIAGTGWRPILLINVPICAAAIAAAARIRPADRSTGSVRVDPLGIATLSATLLLLVPPLVLGREQGWPLWTWICLTASVPAFALFLATQRYVAAAGREPLVTIEVLARRPITLGLAALLLATGTYYALLFTLAQFVQTGLGRSALVSGLLLVPWVAAFGLAGQLIRRFPQRWQRNVPVAGYLLLAAAYLAIAATVWAGHPDDLVLLVLLGIGGLGLGTGFVTLLGHLTNATPGRYASDISGVSTTTLQIGGALGVATVGSLYLSLTGNHNAQAGHAFAVTVLVLAAISLLSALCAVAAVRVPASRQARQPAAA